MNNEHRMSEGDKQRIQEMAERYHAACNGEYEIPVLRAVLEGAVDIVFKLMDTIEAQVQEATKDEKLRAIMFGAVLQYMLANASAAIRVQQLMRMGFSTELAIAMEMQGVAIIDATELGL